MRILIFIIAIFILNGCSGNVYTVKNPIIESNKKVLGIPFYGYKIQEKTVLLDRIRNPKTGEITHSMYESESSKKYCKPDKRIDKIPVADYSQLYYIYYDPAFFESSKFGVTLEKGMLTSINSESTPGPKVAIETLQGIASLREDILNGFNVQESLVQKKSIILCSEEK